MPVLFPHSVLRASLAVCLLGLLSACANTNLGNALQRSLGADPTLKDNPPKNLGGPSPNKPQSTPQKQKSVPLPEDFPTEIPRYQQATLAQVEPLKDAAGPGKLTIWSSPDPINLIQNFYQKTFESGGWEVLDQPEDQDGGTFIVRRNDLDVTLSIPSGATTGKSSAASSSKPPAVATNSSVTTFDIQYVRDGKDTKAEKPQASQKPTQPPKPQPSQKPTQAQKPTQPPKPQPSQKPTQAQKPTQPPKPQPPSEVASKPAKVRSGQPEKFTDLDKVPRDLRKYVADLAELGVLTPDTANPKTNADSQGTQFAPNQTISRRQYARWLMDANNRIYANRPGLQIRLASKTTQPAFQDVPRTDPDFPYIQGLADAGLISSPLSGDSTAVLFRPDAPLTRENLMLWKVPLDTRKALPKASIEAVKETWGFKDTAEIDPKALRAVLADFRNGDLANIRRVFGYTILFQPKKPVTRAEAGAALWYFGSQGEGQSAKEALFLKPQTSQPSGAPKATSSN
ncbi:MAG: S-layer homology domain-containing protein [Moorea sp. SIOASIH]|nr:S-layer homology domain-containing protein [Moorena sp. SIOASIH]